ncbi:MAG: hypothetical protein FWG65_10885 [Turicibacter sp.]|nr:hypothetical protein [Turicibacter sp.]
MNKTYQLTDLLTKTQEELASIAQEKLTSCGYTLEIKEGKYIVGTTETENPITLLAHLDLVNKTPPQPQDIIFESEHTTTPERTDERTYTGAVYRLENSQATCLGADDRNGIFAIFSLLDKGYRPYVIFTHDEEVGCVGGGQLREDLENLPQLRDILNQSAMLIQVDRGSKYHFDEVVYYNEKNEQFMDFIQDFGFTDGRKDERVTGSSTDVRVLSEILTPATCNVSAGYVREHGENELCLWDGLTATIDKLERIMRKCQAEGLVFEKVR